MKERKSRGRMIAEDMAAELAVPPKMDAPMEMAMQCAEAFFRTVGGRGADGVVASEYIPDIVSDPDGFARKRDAMAADKSPDVRHADRAVAIWKGMADAMRRNASLAFSGTGREIYLTPDIWYSKSISRDGGTLLFCNRRNYMRASITIPMRTGEKYSVRLDDPANDRREGRSLGGVTAAREFLIYLYEATEGNQLAMDAAKRELPDFYRKYMRKWMGESASDADGWKALFEASWE